MKLKFLNLSNLLILLTLLAIGIIVATVISPYLHFNYQQIGFLTGADFFSNYASYPGGIADYLGLFISQFFSFNLAGSLLIVAVVGLQGFMALNMVKSLAGSLPLRYSIFSAIVLFGVVILCDYRYPYYASIKLLFAYIFTWGFCRLNSKWPTLSTLIWPALAILLFYVASGAALLVFALSTVLILLITQKPRTWMLAAPLFLLVAGLLPYVGYKYLFQITLSNIYNITMVKPPAQLAYEPGIPLYISYALLPAILLGVGLFIYLSKKRPVGEPIIATNKGAKASLPVAFYQKIPILVLMQVVVWVASGYFLFEKSHDPLKKQLIILEYYAENHQWTEVLKLAEEIETYDFRINFQVNRAYSHLGQLPEYLMNYPQLLGSSGLFIDPTMTVGSTDMPTSDLYFDLGFMNESQHWAFEAETLLPNSPRILKRLVMINLVNGKYDLAEIFLNVLNKNILCRDWVRKYEKYVADTTLAASDPVIAEKRRFNPHKKVLSPGTLDGLKLLFETNPDNRMAYDYLLAYCILDSHLSEFVNYLQHYQHYNLKNLPRSWEEVLAIYIVKTKSFPDFVTPETISEQCRKRMTNFNAVVKSFNNDLPAAKNTLIGRAHV